MNYYTEEIQTGASVQNTAGVKARDDISCILEQLCFAKICIEFDNEKRKKTGLFSKLLLHHDVKLEWDHKTSDIEAGSTLYIQFPLINHSLFFNHVIRRLRSSGVRIVLLIHDLELFRWAQRKDIPFGSRIRIALEEKQLLTVADYLIVHNEKMKEKLASFGIRPDKMIELKLFDYLIPDDNMCFHVDLCGLEKPVIIAGALRRHKSGYLYKLPQDLEYNLYGVGYEDPHQNNIHYYGAFPPDLLPFELNGSFGLVWDGPETYTCAGVYGEYLRINNPHKVSLYLASGLPVIIWNQAALADFIVSNHLGIAVESIEDIPQALEHVDKQMYSDFLEHVAIIGKKLRAGKFTIDSIRAIEKKANRS